MTVEHTSTTVTFRVIDEADVVLEDPEVRLRAYGVLCIMSPAGEIRVIDVTGDEMPSKIASHIRFDGKGHRSLSEVPKWILTRLEELRVKRVRL